MCGAGQLAPGNGENPFCPVFLLERLVLFTFDYMFVATLSSFATQFEPALVAAGKALFEGGKVGPLVNDKLNWQAKVTDTKNYQVTVRLEKKKATDIFCPCGPAVCRHVIAVLCALQQQLQVKAVKFTPALLKLPPEAAHVLLGQRLNDLVYASRAAGSKDGELEALGAGLSLKDPDVLELRKLVRKKLFYPHDRSTYPILNGAKALLGAAILKYEQKDYNFVFAIAKAVLTDICSGEEYMYGGVSARECAQAAVELLNTLCTDRKVPAAFRREVFERVLFACKKDLYRYYHKELLTITDNPRLEQELQELAARELNGGH